jgi:chemotaxis signal transduction protein
MTEIQTPADRAEAYRREFDHSFALPVRTASQEVDDFIRVRAAGHSYALRIDETAGLLVDRKIVGVPSEMPEFLGILGFRGEIVPVYALGAILGHDPGKTARWVVIARAEDIVGFGFDEVEGHVRVAHANVIAADAEAMGRCINRVARTEGANLPVISVPALVDRIRQRQGPIMGQKEER